MKFNHKTLITGLLSLMLSIAMTSTAWAKSGELEFKAAVTEIKLPVAGDSFI